jgi:hypothetical protein
VRVACPARGTALLTDNLEVFLSGLLNLIRKAGGWAAGAAIGAASGPIAGAKAKAATDKGLAVLTRIVIEIANRRLDPRSCPASRPCCRTPPWACCWRRPHRPDTRMAIIAGDIEGGGLAKRLGTMFTDWMFFDRADNDLVVDTASMYGGLAYQAGPGDLRPGRERQSLPLLPRRHRHRRRPPAALRHAPLADRRPTHRIARMGHPRPTGNRSRRVAPGAPASRGDTRRPSSSSCPASWAAT